MTDDKIILREIDQLCAGMEIIKLMYKELGGFMNQDNYNDEMRKSLEYRSLLFDRLECVENG